MKFFKILLSLYFFQYLCLAAMANDVRYSSADDLSHIMYSNQIPPAKSFVLDWWSASVLQIKQATCREKITDSQILQYLETSAISFPLISKNIEGINFENQNQSLLQDLVELIIPRENFQQEPISREILVAKALTCSTVLCAVRKIFGHNIGPKILYLKIRYGFNASYLAFEHASNPTEVELNAMIAGSAMYPDYIFPLVLERNKQMTKFLRGFTLGQYNEEVEGNSMITFFDGWSLEDAELKEYAVVHEIAHFLGSYFGLDESSLWKQATICEKGKNCFVSKYAKGNSIEDFAESVASYRYSSEKLKKISSKKYKFIQQTVFRNIEFTDAQKCKNENVWDQTFVSDLSQSNPTVFSNMDNSLNLCPQLFLDYIVRPSQITADEYQSCILNKIIYAHMPSDFSQATSLNMSENSDLLELSKRALLTSNGIVAVKSQILKSESALSLQLPQITLTWSQKLQKQLDHDIVTELLIDTKRKNFLFGKHYDTAQEFCSKWTSLSSGSKNYGYQVFENIIKTYLSTADRNLGYKNKELLSPVKYKVCENIMKARGNQSWSSFTQDELSLAWSKR